MDHTQVLLRQMASRSPRITKTLVIECDLDDKYDKVTKNEKVAAMEEAAKTLGKSKDTTFHANHLTSKHLWLISTIRRVIQAPPEPPLQKSKFTFKNTRHAAKQNHRILKQNKYDLTTAISNNGRSSSSPGSKFRMSSQLESIFADHEYWENIKQIVDKGITYALKPLDKKQTVRPSRYDKAR